MSDQSTPPGAGASGNPAPNPGGANTPGTGTPATPNTPNNPPANAPVTIDPANADPSSGHAATINTTGETTISVATDGTNMPVALNYNNTDVAGENDKLLKHLNTVLRSGTDAVKKIRRKLNYTYTLLVIMSVILFVVGIGLLIASAIFFFKGGGSEATQDFFKEALTTSGMGILDLSLLLVMKPFKQIRQLMGDMGQMTMIINGYQTQVGLVLLGIDINNRESISEAITKVQTTVKLSVTAIEQYFEAAINSDNS